MNKEPRRRQDVPQEDRWNIEALYPNDAAWEADFARAQSLPAQVEAYSGRLAESPETLAAAIRALLDAYRHIEKVYVYAHLRNDEDLGNSTYQSMFDRARTAYIQLSTAASYFSPELLAIDDATMAEWLGTDLIAPYRVWLEDILRGKPYTLSPSEERLMSMAAEPLGAISKVFSVLKNVDLAARLPAVQDEDGDEQQLTHASFIRLLESRDRTVRKNAFDRLLCRIQGQSYHQRRHPRRGDQVPRVQRPRPRLSQCPRRGALWRQRRRVGVRCAHRCRTRRAARLLSLRQAAQAAPRRRRPPHV
jgi:oligoendopeptidase F